MWACFWDLRRGLSELVAIAWSDVLLWANTISCSYEQMLALQDAIVTLDDIVLTHGRQKALEADQKRQAERARTKS